MAFEKLTKAELSRYRGGRRSAHPEYIQFLQDLKVGEGGWTTVEQEKASRQTIKNRLNRAAESLDMSIKFKRSDASKVVFEVVKTA